SRRMGGQPEDRNRGCLPATPSSRPDPEREGGSDPSGRLPCGRAGGGAPGSQRVGWGSWGTGRPPAEIVRTGRIAPPVAPPHDREERREEEDCGEASESDEAEDRGAVLSGSRIVVVAIEQDLVDGGADLASRGLDQRQPQVARRVLDPVEIAGETSIGCRDVNRA